MDPLTLRKLVLRRVDERGVRQTARDLGWHPSRVKRTVALHKIAVMQDILKLARTVGVLRG